MESFLNRYRNITVLLLVIFAQLVLLAAQVKNDQDVRVIRVWAVTAVTPVARLVEGLRGGGSGFLHNYILLHDTNDANKRLQAEVDRLRMENIYLKNQLNTAERAQALQVFQSQTPSKTVAATIIGIGAGSNSKVIFVDRGVESGVQRGMAVVTPDGIVGKVIAAYPLSSEVELITDADFAAGVISQRTGIRGTLKGLGKPNCKIDYVPFEEKVEIGDWFYTSGDDRIFPRGFPVGVVKSVQPDQPFKEILIEPTGLRRGLEDVLILIHAVHQSLPEVPPAAQPVYLAPPPPAASAEQTDVLKPATAGTEADRLKAQYKVIGESQNHKFGEGLPGSKPPDFNVKLPNGVALPAPPLPKAGQTDAARRANQDSGGGEDKSKTGAAKAPAKTDAPKDAPKQEGRPTEPPKSDTPKQERPRIENARPEPPAKQPGGNPPPGGNPR